MQMRSLTTAVFGLSLMLIPAAQASAQGTAPSGSQGQHGTEHAGGKANKTKAKAGDPQAFVMEAAHGGHAEVELGKLATAQAKHEDVKAFGQQMVTDHGNANQELASLASSKGWKVPADPGPKHKADAQRLGRLNGEQFDRAYMQHMLKDHEKTVSLFEQGSKQLEDAELRGWAEKTLPTLRQHLEKARSVAAAVGAGKGTKTPSQH